MYEPSEQAANTQENIWLAIGLTLKPCFDPQRLASAFGEMPDQPSLDAARAFFAECGQALRAVRLEAPGHTACVALWLPQPLEERIGAAWSELPSRALLLHATAHLCVEDALAQCVPAVASHGCAPVPPSHAGRERVLAEQGLPCPQGVMARRYAVLCFTAEQLCCALCACAAECPRRKANVETSNNKG